MGCSVHSSNLPSPLLYSFPAFRVIAQKIGYAGEDEPRYVFPTVVGHPTIGSEKYRKPAPPTCRDEEYVSKDDVEVIQKSAGGVLRLTLIPPRMFLDLISPLFHYLNLPFSLFERRTT